MLFQEYLQAQSSLDSMICFISFSTCNILMISGKDAKLDEENIKEFLYCPSVGM